LFNKTANDSTNTDAISDFELLNEIKEINNNVSNFNSLPTINEQQGGFNYSNVLDGAIDHTGGHGSPFEIYSEHRGGSGDVDVEDGEAQEVQQSSRHNKATLKKGTLLYYGWKGRENRTVDTELLDFDTSDPNAPKIIAVSTDHRLALAAVGACAPFSRDSSGRYGVPSGVHVFRVKKTIESLFVLTQTNVPDDPSVVFSRWCGPSGYRGEFYDGVIYYVNNANIKTMTGTKRDDDGTELAEVLLCQYAKFLEYVKTYDCASTRNLVEYKSAPTRAPAAPKRSADVMEEGDNENGSAPKNAKPADKAIGDE
jgi:hypothetical protein